MFRSSQFLKGASIRQPPSPLLSRRRPIRPLCSSESPYDYVIVGGGAAGCLLANRLSADDNKRVLLVEAGSGKQDRTIHVPAGITRLFKSDYDWNLYSTPQKQLDDRLLYLARGKVIGGSSSTNATLYHRGTAQDYDDWGLEGWKGEDVLKWFTHVEDYVDGGSAYHGKGGLMHVEHPRYENMLHGVMLNAAREMGWPFNPDFNDWSHPQEGFGEFDVTQKIGVRADAFRQFLRPALKRQNLHVESDARVSKILFEGRGDRQHAVGIEFRRTHAEGLKREVALTPGGEVLLCAGAIHSPHLLMLSGIGPGQHLRDRGIEVVEDLPGVGSNLQDHPAALSAFTLRPQYEHLAVTNIFTEEGKIKRRVMLQYLFFKKGPLCTTSCDHGAFVTTAGHDQPNVQIRFNPGYALDPDGVGSFIKFGQLLDQGNKWPGGVTFQIVACRPQSTGKVTLASDDPLIDPAVDAGFLTDPDGEDVKTLIAGLKLNRDLAKTTVLNGFLDEEGFPGKDKKTDSELEGFIRETIHSANALVGSCRMGPNPIGGDVVSASDLKVHGVDGLRVIDASVMPKIPGGQTGAPTVMIAEKAAYTMLHCNQD